MSERPDHSEKNSAELTNGEDTTQPTDEILNVLQQLNPPTTEASQPQSQDPPSEWVILRTQLSEKPHDPDGWRKLVELAETGGDLEQVKETYEALLVVYPHTVHSILS